MTANGICSIDVSEIYDGAVIYFTAEGFTD